MIIIHVMGGLGNQMFQYSLCQKLLHLGKEVKLDLGSYGVYQQHNGFEIDKIFNTRVPTMSASDIERFRVGYGVKMNGVIVRDFIHEKHLFKADKEMFDLDEGYLYGYWASEKYFNDIEEVIKREFTFKNQLDYINRLVKKDMENTNSVALHIRRGDYLIGQNNDLYINLYNIGYYDKAIEYIKNKIDRPKFFIFSNDPQWVKENLKIDGDVEYIQHNSGVDSYKDMELMSSCKHNIVANSSFSWWAAWLNGNKDKIVVTPKEWVNMSNVDNSEVELFPEGWKII